MAYGSSAADKLDLHSTFEQAFVMSVALIRTGPHRRACGDLLYLL